MDNPTKLLVLLEQSYFEAKQSATQDLREALMAGLNWETNYWVDCALCWIEEGAELDRDMVKVLESISSNKNHPQSTRHKAFKLAKSWLRGKKT